MCAAAFIAEHEPAAFLEERVDGQSPFFITVDHASARVPAALSELGVSDAERARHIAWDIGALAVARGMSTSLDAALIASNYSRLVIDCNRDPRVPSAFVPVSEFTPIPGNIDLSDDDRKARADTFFWPYQNRIAQRLDERAAAGRRTILVCQHTMTPVFKGQVRPMHAAVLYNRDPRFALAVRDALVRDPSLQIAVNEPYEVSDETDFTVPVHAERRGLLHVEIEVRQDLVMTPVGQQRWARVLSAALLAAREQFPRGP